MLHNGVCIDSDNQQKWNSPGSDSHRSTTICDMCTSLAANICKLQAPKYCNIVNTVHPDQYCKIPQLKN